MLALQQFLAGLIAWLHVARLATLLSARLMRALDIALFFARRALIHAGMLALLHVAARLAAIQFAWGARTVRANLVLALVSAGQNLAARLATLVLA